MKHIIAVVVFVVAAVGISLLLIPRGEELGLMNLRDKSYAEAQRAYERELERAGLQVKIALPLMDVYEFNGEIDKATMLAERLRDAPSRRSARAGQAGAPVSGLSAAAKAPRAGRAPGGGGPRREALARALGAALGKRRRR